MDKVVQTKKLTVGWYEIGDLPALNISDLPIKIDTGAKTSSIHASDIKLVEENGEQFVHFYTACAQNGNIEVIAPLHDIRRVKSSNGQIEERYVIRTPLTLGEQTWDIDITLTCREKMEFNMLLGRRAMSNIQVIPAEENLLNSDKKLNIKDQ